MKSLEEVLHAARSLGHAGIAVVAHGPHGPYVAMCVGPDGRPSDPRNWDAQPTPDAALEDLYRMMTTAQEALR